MRLFLFRRGRRHYLRIYVEGNILYLHAGPVGEVALVLLHLAFYILQRLVEGFAQVRRVVLAAHDDAVYIRGYLDHVHAPLVVEHDLSVKDTVEEFLNLDELLLHVVLNISGEFDIACKETYFHSNSSIRYVACVSGN